MPFVLGVGAPVAHAGKLTNGGGSTEALGPAQPDIIGPSIHPPTPTCGLQLRGELFVQVFCWVMGVLLGAELSIDRFVYKDTESAREVWRAVDHSPSVEVIAQKGGGALFRLDAPFASHPQLPRVAIERSVALDLTLSREFAFEGVVDDPQALRGASLYFRSGPGWYVASRPLAPQRCQELRFSRSVFREEGKPSGWSRIDGVRLAFWPASSEARRSTPVCLGRLAAVLPDLAFVTPRHEAERTHRERKFPAKIVAWLEELDLRVDRLDDSAAALEALEKYRIAVLAPDLTIDAPCLDALVRFLAAGGKLVSLTPLPRNVRSALGCGEAARDEDCEHGALACATIPSADSEARIRLFEAVGCVAPSLKKTMATAEFRRAERIGEYRRVSEFLAGIASPSSEIGPRVAAASQTWRQANEALSAGEYSAALRKAAQAHDGFVRAYLLAAPSPAQEARALWNHSGVGAFPGDWERSADLLAKNGFNMVLPNMLWGGIAHYASEVLPRSSAFARYGDQIEQCCAAAKRHGLEVHVWKVCFLLATAPKEFVERMQREGRVQCDVSGRSCNWLCPTNPENRRLELASLAEIVRRYPVAGLHMDYMRYPSRDRCYCEGCRRRFEAERGVRVDGWPEACHSGPLRQEYNDWRCRQITELVAAIARQARGIRPDIKISASVFGAYPDCRDTVAQDWPSWIKAGSLDFICPMNYTEDDGRFAALIQRQIQQVEGRIPIYVGIGANAANVHLASDRVVGQTALARQLGAKGFALFDLTPQTAATLVPDIGCGAGSRRATPPHREWRSPD